MLRHFSHLMQLQPRPCLSRRSIGGLRLPRARNHSLLSKSVLSSLLHAIAFTMFVCRLESSFSVADCIVCRPQRPLSHMCTSHTAWHRLREKAALEARGVGSSSAASGSLLPLPRRKAGTGQTKTLSVAIEERDTDSKSSIDNSAVVISGSDEFIVTICDGNFAKVWSKVCIHRAMTAEH